MRKITISRRLTLGFGILIILSLLLAGAGIWADAQLDSILDEALSLSQQRLTIGEIESALQAQMEAEMSYLLQPDEDRLTEYAQNKATVLELLDEYATLTDARTVGNYRAKYDQLTQSIDHHLDLAKSGDLEGAIASEFEQSDQLLENLRADIEAEEQRLDDLMEVNSERDKRTHTLTYGVLASLGIIIPLVSAALAFFTARSITQPTALLTQDAQRLTGGDLSKTISSPGKDELTTLAGSFEAMRSELAGIIKNMQSAVGRAAAASAELAAQAQHQAAASTEQAASVSEVTASVEELNRAAQSIAETADRVAHAAEQALNGAQIGQEAASASVQSSENVQAKMSALSERITALGEQSRQVGAIVALIGDIANETHLLSLNASIEAAGAGEHGKRFAVVAAEVKRLAERAATAAGEVRNVVTEMQGAVNSAVVAVESAAREVSIAARQAQDTGQAIGSIVEQVSDSAQAAREISVTTQQQQTASSQLVIAMHDLSTLAEQMAAASRDASQSATQLSEIATNLTQISTRFKVAV
jgi:methyl-accepting chemotaxis protein